jgi:hypothetical protein
VSSSGHDPFGTLLTPAVQGAVGLKGSAPEGESMRGTPELRALAAGGLAVALAVTAAGLAWAGKEDRSGPFRSGLRQPASAPVRAGALTAADGFAVPGAGPAAVGSQGSGAAASGPELAVISSWRPADYAKLPAGSLALVNPGDGILAASPSDVTAARTAVAAARQRGVRFLGYVPTGYGDRVSGHDNGHGSVGRSTSDIVEQITLYASTFGSDLEGIFFDETSQDCTSAATDYAQFSALAHAAGFTWSAMNPGRVGDGYCYVDATPAGDIVVTFDSDLTSYLAAGLAAELQEGTRRAHARGALTWHLVHGAQGTAGVGQALQALRERAPDLGYVIDYSQATPSPSRSSPGR